MTRALIYLVLGAVLLALAIWWWNVIGPSFAFLAPIILMGIGGALIVSSWAVFLDVRNPTSRKL